VAAALNGDKEGILDVLCCFYCESKALSAGGIQNNTIQYNRQIIINLDVAVHQSRFKSPFGRPIQLGF
jgi:hypothetical protein